MDKNIADNYIHYARSAYDSKQYHEAASILKESASFAVANSDYHVLKALLSMQNNSYRLATTELELALKYFKTNKIFAKSEIVSEIIPLYYRLKNYNAIVRLYEDRSDNSYHQVAFYYLLALRNLGRQEDLIQRADELLAENPYDCRLYFALLNLPKMHARYLDTFRLLSLSTAPQILTSIERSIFLASIKRIEESTQRKDILNIGYRWLQDDENYHIYATKYDLLLPQVTTPLLPSFFKEFDEEHIDDYTMLMTQGVTINVGIDTDLDGFPDELALLSSDSSYWLYRRAHDSSYYYKINLVKGLILSIEERRGTQQLLWEFSNYPTIKQVTILSSAHPEGRKVIYHLLPKKISMDTSQSRSIIHDWTPIPSLNSKNNLPQESSLLLASYQLDEYIADKIFRTMTVRLGEVTSIMEDSQGSGYFDHMMVIKDWKVLYGKRDVGHRGSFDLYEYYHDGVWQGLAYAPDGDGKISYYEDWKQAPIKLWDFNQDSFINGYSLTLSNNTEITVEPYSQRLFQAEDFLSWDFSRKEHWFDE